MSLYFNSEVFRLMLKTFTFYYIRNRGEFCSSVFSLCFRLNTILQNRWRGVIDASVF